MLMPMPMPTQIIISEGGRRLKARFRSSVICPMRVVDLRHVARQQAIYIYM